MTPSKVWRLLAAPGVSQADYVGVALATYMELGIIRRYGRWAVQPYLSLRLVNIRNNAHPILIAGASAINAQKATTFSARTSLGLRALYRFTLSRLAITVKGRVAYVGEMADINQSVRFTNLAGGISSKIESARSDRHMANGGVTIFINVAPRIQLFVDYNVLVGPRALIQAVWGAIRFRW